MVTINFIITIIIITTTIIIRNRDRIIVKIRKIGMLITTLIIININVTYVTVIVIMIIRADIV